MKPYPPAKLRFHEVTLRTPEEARADEMKAASGVAYRATPDDEPVEVLTGSGVVCNVKKERIRGING